MPKDTFSLGNTKAPICENRGFGIKKRVSFNFFYKRICSAYASSTNKDSEHSQQGEFHSKRQECLSRTLNLKCRYDLIFE